MGFYYEEAKRDAAAKPKSKAAPRGHIPIESMNRAGCSACPRDKDRALESPKMEAEGSDSPEVYFLSTRPTHQEDKEGRLWVGPAGREILKKARRARLDDDVRLSNIVNCSGADMALDVREVECCRGRVAEDIERAAPLVVVGVGDEPLHWATGLPKNARAFRGTLMPARFGRHECWYYPVLYPNYTNRESRRKSEYETTLEHDLASLEQMLRGSLGSPKIHGAPYDAGIECITGSEPGDMGRLEDALHWLCGVGPHGLDYETSEIDPHAQADPKIWTAAAGTFGRVVAFSVDHPDGWGTETRMRKVRGMLGEYVAQSGRKRCHHAGFEQAWTARIFGNEVLRRTEWDDTMAMAFTFDEREGTKSLDNQCRVRFGFFLKAQSQVDVSVPGWHLKYKLRDILRYNGLDSKWTDLLADHYLPMLREDERAMAVYEMRMRTCPTLVLTTDRGLPVDLGYARRLSAELDAKIADVEERLRRTPEVRRYTSQFGTFSPTNDKHVLAMMKDVLKRPEVRREDRDKTVRWTSDDEALSAMPRAEVPSAQLVLDHRGLTRNNSTYLGPLIEGKTLSADGALHYEYDQMKAVTGRLTSRAHNWPKHKFREVRGAVAAKGGDWMVASDQGQIEFRVFGMLSEDRNIVKYSWTGYDVHGFWAQRMAKEYPPVKDWICEEFSIDWDEKGMKTLRQVVKNNWVFPLMFGSIVDSVARNCHLSDEVAESLAAEFWDEFRGVRKWQERTIEGYNRNLYVETAGGVRRRGPTTVNELINMPVQGTACEIVLGGMNALSERADAEGRPELQPAFNGHDDLTFIVPDALLERSVEAIAYEMAMPRYSYVIVPLIVEVSVGSRWDRLEEVGKFSGADIFNLENPYA